MVEPQSPVAFDEVMSDDSCDAEEMEQRVLRGIERYTDSFYQSRIAVGSEREPKELDRAAPGGESPERSNSPVVQTASEQDEEGDPPPDREADYAAAVLNARTLAAHPHPPTARYNR